MQLGKMIQIRHVPDTLHRKLKARAATEGLSLSDYLLAQIRQIAERPTLAEMIERLHRAEKVNLPISAADLIRQERDSR
jgi:plasmid stability protein